MKFSRIGLSAVAAAALAPAALGASATHPEIHVGGFPTGVALNPLTHTIYVGNGTSGTVSVINGRTCNAAVKRGCGQHVTAVTAGIDPIGIGVDTSTNTVYVVNISGTVAVVDGSRCDAANTSGCKAVPATVTVGTNPQFLAVDSKTHTVYVANPSDNRISVIDGRTCNASTRAGCVRLRASISVGPLPFTLAINQRTDTLYVTDAGAQTISVIGLATCNAADVSGCGHKPARVNVGEVPGGIAVDSGTNTIYVSGEFSNDLSVVDGRRCNGTTSTGCRQKAARVLAGVGARGVAVNEKTHAVYVANTGENTISVIDGASCNGTVHRGCSKKAAVAPVGISPRRVGVDELTNTVYVTNAGSNSVTVIDGRTCSGTVHSGCGGSAHKTPVA